MSDNSEETRQERRAKKIEKKREKVQQHGKGLAQIYKDVILKRLKKGKDSQEQ